MASKYAPESGNSSKGERNFNRSSEIYNQRRGSDMEDSHYINAMFVFIAILSIVGNCLVLLLFIRNKKWLQRTYGRLVLALAVTDLLTALCLFATPFTIHYDRLRRTPKGKLGREMFCRLVWSHYVLFSFGVTSVYTCLVLTAERWIAVAKPLYIRRYKPSRRALLSCVVLPWLAGFLLEANVIKETSAQSFEDGTFSCSWMAHEHTGESTSALLATLSFLGAIFVPLVMITVMYGHILVRLKRENIKREVSYQAQSIASTSRFYKLALRRATKMAACATFAVIICWLPCQTYSLLAQLGFVETETLLHQVLNLLAFFNSCVNPVLYAFSNGLFRKKFTDTFARLSCHNPSPSDIPSVFV